MGARMRFICAAFVSLIVLSSSLQAAPTVVDLTTPGSSGQINGAWFYQADPKPTGTGYIRSFVRLQTNDDISQGYNTDGRPLQFDENESGEFTRSLRLADVPVVTFGETEYREFLLDINESKGGDKRLLSLDTIEIYLGGSGDLLDYPNLGTLIYDLDDGADNWILLDYSLNPGSGGGDMLAYIPNSLFTGEGDYVYLYSRFGENHANTAGFEEWAVREHESEYEPPVVIPAPGAILLVGLGSIVVGLLRGRLIS